MTAHFIESAKRTLTIEAEALMQLRNLVDDNFSHACNAILNSTGRAIVVGLGKSGHIAKKIAATLASTGTPAFYIHATEASHGDLGMITAEDIVIALSNSGETIEVLSLIPMLKKKELTVIALTGNPESTLAQRADIHINVAVDSEACPLNLAPTSSTTATLAMGDALAVALLEARNFTATDFAGSHPGGSLGKRLIMKVSEIMETGERIPHVPHTAMLKDAIFEMSSKGLGMTALVDNDNKIVGIFTDGDLRRAIDSTTILDIKNTRALDIASKNFLSVEAEELAANALEFMENNHINGLFILDDARRIIGALNMHTIFKSGLGS